MSRADYELNDVGVKKQKERYPQTKEDNGKRFIYKYVSTDSAKKCLELKENEKGTLRFAEPSTWADPAEKALYDANYTEENGKPWERPIVYACCITDLQQSEAAWATYQYQGNDGCVKFSIDYDKLIEQLKQYAEEEGCLLYVGRVEYGKWSDISGTNKDRLDEIFSKLGGKDDESMERNFLRYLLIKREAFAYEKEIRLFIVYNRDKAPKKKDENEIKDSILVPINWKKCLNKVYVGEECKYRDIREIKYLIKKIDFRGRNVDDIVDATDLYEAKDMLNITLIGTKNNNQSTNEENNETKKSL